MKNSRIRSFLWTLLLVFVPLAGFTQGYLEFEQKIEKVTLPNGLVVLLLEKHEAPVVSMVTFADVGAANEVKGITGIAHLFEHMAFKGTTTVGTEDIKAEKKAMEKEDNTFNAWLTEYRKGDKADKEKLAILQEEHKSAMEKAREYVVSNELGQAIEIAGGSGLNAGTGYDLTVYFYNLPSNKLELWMSLESDRFLNPVLREFYTEKNVVMEERRMRVESSPFGRLVEEFLCIAYKAHPYGEPAVGHMSDLMTITRQDALDFFKTNYTPQNLVLAIVGDFQTKNVKKLLQTYWGRIPAGPEREPVDTVEPPQLGQRQVEVDDFMQPIVIIGYHRPDRLHKDNAVLDAISDLLGTGRTCRLYKSLVKDKKIAIQIQAVSGVTSLKYPGLFAFIAVPSQGHTIQECEDSVYEEINRLKTEPVPRDELAALKTRAKVNFLRSLEGNQGLAFQLATSEGLDGDFHAMFKQVEKIEAITPEDIQRVSKQVFSRRNRTVAKIVPPEKEAE
ncbi:insulinase family protein [candidate division KSB1 bacterium]|nr:insulinase family protein [candidate division KSB1 bacterium]